MRADGNDRQIFRARLDHRAACGQAVGRRAGRCRRDHAVSVEARDLLAIGRYADAHHAERGALCNDDIVQRVIFIDPAAMALDLDMQHHAAVELIVPLEQRLHFIQLRRL